MDSRRVYTAAVFIPFFFILVNYSNALAFLIFVLAGVLIAQYEYFLFHEHRVWCVPSAFVGALMSVGIGVSFYAGYQVPLGAGFAGVVAVLGTGYVVTYLGRRSSAVTDPIIILFGSAYIGWMLSHLILLHKMECGIALIFFVFLVTWGADTAAYYVGSLFGTHKFAPRISPGKTIEGAFGGLIGAVMMALVAKIGFMPWLDVADCVILGLLLGSVGLVGDLFESRLKRHAGVKDSGTILPGHGGLLDRVDSLIFTSPVFYYYVVLIESRAQEFCV